MVRSLPMTHNSWIYLILYTVISSQALILQLTWSLLGYWLSICPSKVSVSKSDTLYIVQPQKLLHISGVLVCVQMCVHTRERVCACVIESDKSHLHVLFHLLLLVTKFPKGINYQAWKKRTQLCVSVYLFVHRYACARLRPSLYDRCQWNLRTRQNKQIICYFSNSTWKMYQTCSSQIRGITCMCVSW